MCIKLNHSRNLPIKSEICSDYRRDESDLYTFTVQVAKYELRVHVCINERKQMNVAKGGKEKGCEKETGKHTAPRGSSGNGETELWLDKVAVVVQLLVQHAVDDQIGAVRFRPLCVGFLRVIGAARD